MFVFVFIFQALEWVWWLTGANAIWLLIKLTKACARVLLLILSTLGFDGQFHSVNTFTTGTVFSSPKFAKQVCLLTRHAIFEANTNIDRFTLCWWRYLTSGTRVCPRS